MEGACDFAEECGLAVLRFDERDLQLGHEDLDRQAGETGAGADVDQASLLLAGRKEMSGSKEGLPEVSLDDGFRVADGGETDACVPAEEEFKVAAELGELALGKRHLEEGRHEVGDACGQHGGSVIGRWSVVDGRWPWSCTRPQARLGR